MASYFNGEMRSQFLMMALIALSVLLAFAVNTAITAWIQDKYATNLTQAYFVYALLVFLAVLVMAWLFGRWVINSSRK